MKKFKAIVTESSTIREAVALMGNAALNKGIPGIAVIVDADQKVIGVSTDGDLRRGLAGGVELSDSISKITNFSPVTIPYDLSPAQMRAEVLLIAKKRNAPVEKFNKIILVNDQGRFYDLILLSEIMEEKVENKIIAVYGMGYVGLTLGVVLANSGFTTIGIDLNQKMIAMLKSGKPSFFENGLDSMLQSLVRSDAILFTSEPDHIEADVHIICVGTPLSADKKPDMSFIEQVSLSISARLKKNDVVIFRSTLPLGTTRKFVLPILERSGLIPGKEFHLVFAPERTVEGNALQELQVLPQIIGGLTPRCNEIAAQIFKKITHTIIEVESLEAAEIVKLMNNTFRDLVFSFANEVSYICDTHNINTFKVIEAANEGYPRNPIPKPSPGVGGLCLSKDPYLFSHTDDPAQFQPSLGVTSRKINEFGPQAVYNKILKFCQETGKSIEKITILIVGIAFKGTPETTDIRDSVTLKLLALLPNRQNITLKDFVVPTEELQQLGYSVVDDIAQGFNGADVVVFMNNHYLNQKFNLNKMIQTMAKPALLFDGWNQFNQTQIEKSDEMFYGTLGYLTKSIKPANQHYMLAKLEEHKAIVIGDQSISVDLDKASSELIRNDEQLKAQVNPNHYFWLSGGGTFLINDRYIVVVRRHASARINPGKFSLFTGRADHIEDWQDPNLLMRELLEELVLFQGEKRVYPIYGPYQSLIDSVLLKVADILGLTHPKHYVEVSPAPSDNPTLVTIKSQGKSFRYKLDMSINAIQDINCVHLLKCTLDTQTLWAKDGEFDLRGDVPNFHNREIYLMDMMTHELRRISRHDTEPVPMTLTEDLSSQHLWNLTSRLSAHLNKKKITI